MLELTDVNGVKFIRELLAAAKRGGGFVEYHWDDPSVKGDEATGSPKLSYTEGFLLPAGTSFSLLARASIEEPNRLFPNEGRASRRSRRRVSTVWSSRGHRKVCS